MLVIPNRLLRLIGLYYLSVELPYPNRFKIILTSFSVGSWVERVPRIHPFSPEQRHELKRSASQYIRAISILAFIIMDHARTAYQRVTSYNRTNYSQYSNYFNARAMIFCGGSLKTQCGQTPHSPTFPRIPPQSTMNLWGFHALTRIAPSTRRGKDSHRHMLTLIGSELIVYDLPA